MNPHIKWTAPEFEYYHKGKGWFIIAGLIAGGLLLWALLTKNFIFALLIGLSYFSLSVYALKKPRQIQLAITPKGVQIDNNIYEFENLKSFWIFYDPPQIREVSLRSRKTIMPYVKIPLGEQNPVEVRQALIKYLPEKKQDESLIDDIAKSLKF